MATRSPPFRRAFAVVATSESSPFAVIADEKRRFYGVQFHPEVVHTPRGAHHPCQFRAQHRRHRSPNGTCTPSAPRRSRRSATRWARRRVICGLVRRRGFLRRRGADPRSDRRPAHLHLRRYRPDARGRGRRSRLAVPRPLQYSADPCRSRATCSWGGSKGVSDPEQKRKIIGAAFIDVFDKESHEGRRRGIPGPGHALSRCDRKRLGHRRARRSPSRAITMSAACPST